MTKTAENESKASDNEGGTETAPEVDKSVSVDSVPGNDEPETFPKSYVEKLRQESAEHRTKAKRSDLLASRLVTSIVARMGVLHDPTDLQFSEELLDDEGMPDEGKITEAVTELANRKPHLVKIRPTGDVGQGSASSPPESSLLDVIQGR